MMLKRDKLYRVNKFDVGGQTLVGVSNAFSGTSLTKPTVAPRINWSSGSGMAQGLGQSKALVNSFGSTARQNNLFAGTGGSSGTIKGPAARESNGWGNIGSYMGAASGVFDGIAAGANNEYSADAQGNGFGLVDRLLTQGKKNKVGRTFVNTGASLTNAGIQSGNGPLALAGGIVGTVGTIINNGWGYKVDEEKLAAVNDATRRNYAFTSNASNLDDIQRPESTNMDTKVYEGGVLTDDDADRKNALLAKTLRESQLFAQRSVDNNINNLLNDQYQNGLANYSAYGGLIDNGLGNENMGAVGYGFMSDYLNTKRKNADNRNQMNNLFMGSPSSMFAGGGNLMVTHEAPQPLFAFGGDMQSNYGDFSTRLTHIDAGQSHEENPNGGVQMGVDNEGTPNLVEEGETIYNDYVFSNRITCDETTKKLFHLPKKKDVTYAELSKKLEREISERPNDPISKAGFKAQMEKLEEQQERQKQEMEAKRAKAAFEALTPEEQTAVMHQVAQQEAMAQQAMAAEAQQQTQPLSPEEVAMTEQQAMQAEPSSEEMLAQQQAQVAALGGRLIKASDVTEEDANMFAVGGRKARKAAKRYNKDWFLAQAKSLGMIDDDATDIEGWTYNPKDPDANLSTFNNKYRDFQKKRALETYRTGQRKSKENELFGSNGLYRYSDDKSKIFKARTNDKDRIGWINADYTGAIDDNGNLKGFLSQEDYNKLSDKDKEAYKRINERAGDKMYDFRGKAIEDIYNGNVDEILGAYNYDDGFKWDDKEAQTLQYPVGMERSNLSYLRYAPALGGAIGLAYDMLNPADYSNAEAVEKSGSIVPMFVRPNYNPTYMEPHVFDVWQQRNRNTANLNSAIRTFENTNNPNKSANILAALYNATNLDGQLGIDADKYNREDAFKVAAHNSGENKTLAQLDMQAQLANQRVYDDAQRLGFQGRLYGARMRDDIDARRAASLSANATNLLQSIGNIGEEAYDEDRLKWLEGTGVLRSDYFNKGKYSAAKGGKLKKKRGLTY